MKSGFWIVASIAMGLAACGNQSDGGTDTACMRTDQAPLGPLQETEIAQACEISPEPGLTIALSPDPEAEGSGCSVAAVFVAPNGFETPRISFGVMTDEGRYTGASAAVRDFLFTDRLTNSSQMQVSDETACAEVSLTVQELRCRISMEDDEDYQACGEVAFEGTDMFAAFETMEN